MSRIVRRKIEDAITGYLQTNAATVGLTSGAIVSANAQAERPDPCLVVAALRFAADPDIQQAGKVTLQIQYHTSGTVGGSERAGIDVILDKVHTFLMKPVDDNAAWGDANREGGALLVALNKPASGTDSRTIKPLHIYDINPTEGAEDIVAEGWVDELVYEVTCQPHDSH